MDARQAMLERNRRAAAPEHLQLQYAQDALTKARKVIQVMDAPKAEVFEDVELSFQEKVSRALDRFYARDDAQSPAATLARESGQFKRRASEIRSELVQLIAALEAAVARDDVAALIEAREKVDTASVRLSSLVGA